jgi:hypothetical protein
MAHPILINRPIVVTPCGVKLAPPSEAVLESLPVPQQGPFSKKRMANRSGQGCAGQNGEHASEPGAWADCARRDHRSEVSQRWVSPSTSSEAFEPSTPAAADAPSIAVLAEVLTEQVCGGSALSRLRRARSELQLAVALPLGPEQKE